MVALSAGHSPNGLVVLKLSTLVPAEAAGQVDAELLDDVALNFGDRNLEQHLIAAANGDAVDDLGAVADQPGGDVKCLLRPRRL